MSSFDAGLWADDSEYFLDNGGGGGGGFDWEGPVLDSGGGGGFDWEGPVLDFSGSEGGFAWEGPTEDVFGDGAFDIGFRIGVTVEEPGLPEFPTDAMMPDITQIFRGIEVPTIEDWPNAADMGLGGGFEMPDITDIFDVPVVSDKDVGLTGKSLWDKIKDALKNIASGGGSGSGGATAPKTTATTSPASSIWPWLLAGAAVLMLTSKDEKK
jgi:hypothetical protein